MAHKEVAEWMPLPAEETDICDCPPGLEYLTHIDQLLVNQMIPTFEMLTGWETQNKFRIRNTLGQQVYFAAESSDTCVRQCCGPIRPFDIGIFDNNQKEVIRLVRPLRCDKFCCFCCLQEMEVQAPPGITIGWIKQEFSFIFPVFSIKNTFGETILTIKGPCWTCKCFDVEFQVMTADGSDEVGKISKHWSGLVKELFTRADNFGIMFPMDLDVKAKAMMLGACLLIDYMFFEVRRGHGGGHGYGGH